MRDMRDMRDQPRQPAPPCVAYQISRSTGAAICRLNSNLPPTDCPCSDYSPDYGTYGPRLNRWATHLMWDQPHDLQSNLQSAIPSDPKNRQEQ